MGAWSSYNLSADVLNGKSRSDAFTSVDEETLASAKDTFRTKVMAKIGTTVLREDSETVFFDKAAAEATLAVRINDGLGLLFLYHHFHDGVGRAGRGLTHEKRAKDFLAESKDAITAFCNSAPVAIGTYSNRSTVAHNTSFMVSYGRASVSRSIEAL